MQIHFKGVIYSCLGIAWICLFSEGIARELTFKQSLKFALENSPTLDSSRRTLKIREWERSNARAKFFPSLDISTQHGLRGSDPNTGTGTRAGSVSLALTETLYDNGNNLTQLKIAGLEKSKSQIDFEKSRGQLCLDVAQQFYRFSLRSQLLEVQRDQYKLLKRQYESIATQYRQGTKTRKDFLRFRTKVQRAEIDLVSAENSIKFSIADLKRTLGFALDSKVQFPGVKPYIVSSVPLSEVSIVPINLKQHYDARLTELTKKINAYNVQLSVRRVWPELSITSGITYDNSDYISRTSSFFGGDSLSWNAMLQIRFNIWDWGIRRRNVKIAKQNEIIQANALDNTLLGIRAEIERLVLDLARLKKNYQLSQELLEMEQKSFSLIQREYRNGKVSFVDLSQALDDLSSARSSFQTVLYTLLQNQVQYWYHQGTIYEKLIES